MKFVSALVLFIYLGGVSIGQEPTPTPTPAPIREEVTVTANRIETAIGDTPASVVNISRTDITTSAAPTVDDILRRTAGFSIFRRSSSRNANPTTQGVSLRGVGATGASRSLVLFDGVPVNDPFGGWVQWNRVPAVALERIEVRRGGASSLYGDAGLSGVINLQPRKFEKKFDVSADVFAGSQTTIGAAVFGGLRRGAWSGDITTSLFQTRGFIPVDPSFRGIVDSPAGVRSSLFSGRFIRSFGDSSIFFRPSYFGEVRANGTGMQTNRTHIRDAVIGGDLRNIGPNVLRTSWRAYGGSQMFDQIFTAVNAARTSESLTRVQRVPVRHAGLSSQVSAVSGNHTLLGGIDLRYVKGSSDELAFAGGQTTSLIRAGGRQFTFGAFGQDLVKVGSSLVIAGSVRYDRWRNYRASTSTLTLSTAQIAVTTFDSREDSSFSPQIAALYHLSDRFSFYGSASRSFRAPTLNELYRSFRVGNVVTNANAALEAEIALNGEAGIAFTTRKVVLRNNVFYTRLSDPITNVTLSSTPTLITRQRQNAGATISRGLEIESELRFRSFDFSVGYLFADSFVAESPSPALQGLRTPQVPKHQLTYQLRRNWQRWTFAVQGRASSAQYDDDLNQFELESYRQVDVFVSRAVGENMRIYTAIENVTNSRYSVGRTPLRTVSSPISMRVGVRWK